MLSAKTGQAAEHAEGKALANGDNEALAEGLLIAH